jgi:hypothetical protein
MKIKIILTPEHGMKALNKFNDAEWAWHTVSKPSGSPSKVILQIEQDGIETPTSIHLLDNGQWEIHTEATLGAGDAV